MDLLSNLRTAAVIAGPEARKLYLASIAEIERCHARLEIDHHFVMKGDDFERRETPYEDRIHFPDKISCMEMAAELKERGDAD